MHTIYWEDAKEFAIASAAAMVPLSQYKKYLIHFILRLYQFAATLIKLAENNLQNNPPFLL